MNCMRFLLSVLVPVCLSVFAAQLQAAPTMLIGIERTLIYEGESLDYQILLSDKEPIDESVTPKMSAFTDFDVQTLPRQKQTVGGSSSRVVINGKVVKDETTEASHILRFSYILTPKKTGLFTLPVPEVNVGGRILSPSVFQVERRVVRDVPNGGIQIAVRPPEPQDLVFLQIKANKNRIYPFQQLDVTLTVQVKALPANIDPNGSINPIQVLEQPPQLSVPWLGNDEALPRGLVPRQDLDEWLAANNVRRPYRGFSINGYVSEGLSSFFDDEDFFGGDMFRKTPLQFLPEPEKIRRPDGKGNQESYWAFRFTRSFVPQQTGRFSFGPVTVKGVFAEGNPAAQQGVSAKELYAFVPAVTMEVADVPEENRPESYIGAFGNFDWSADIQPRKASVGEPLTLTLRLKGQGSVVGVQAPDLAARPEMTDKFKIYPPTDESKENDCQFVYTIRPVQAGSVEFPALPVSFFDTETETFVTRQSEPILLDIAAAETLPSGSVLRNENKPVGEGNPSEQGLFANLTESDGSINESVNYIQWAAVMSSLVLAYTLLTASVFFWRRCNDPASRLRRGALKRAKKRFAALQAEKDEPKDFLLQSIVTDYIADITDGFGQGLTPKEAEDKLQQYGVSQPVAVRVQNFLMMLDAARFGGEAIPFQEQTETAKRLLEEVDRLHL